MRRVANESREAGEVSAFDDDLFHIDLLNLKNYFLLLTLIINFSTNFFHFFQDLHFRFCRPTSGRTAGRVAPCPYPREEGHKDPPR